MKTQIKEQSVAFNKHTKSLKVMLVIMLVISILASALTLLYHGGTYGKPEYSDSISGSIWVNGSKKSQLVDPNNANTGERELPADPTESVTNGGELPVESDVPDDVCPVAEPNNPVGSVKRPLPGYSVWLYDTGDLIQPITNTETDEDGSYCFENLVLGEYVVGIELKAVDDREDLRPMATANDKELFVNEDFDGPPMEFSEPENTDNISGFVWVKDDKSPVFSDTADDDNSKLSVDPDESVDGDIEASAEPDGMIDNDYESLIESDLTNDIGAPTEPDESDEGEMQPLPRYIVNLYDAGDLTRPIDATVTDENGSYRFDKLAPGKYVVGIALEAVDGNEGLIPMGTANGSIFTVNEDFTDPPMAFSDVIDIKADFDSDIAAAPSSDNTYADKPLTIYLAHDYDDPIANAVSVTNNANNGKSEPDCVQNAGVADTSVITDTHLYAGFTAPAANPLFTGWNTKADSSGISYNTGDLLIVDSDIIPYAQWIEDRSGDILKDVDYMENAYINGSQTAQNGAVNAYQPVNRNDTILYQLTINNKWIGSLIPPTIPNPNYFQPKAIPPAKINFINGGFEEPYIATSALLEGHYEFIHMSNVPGWSTEPVHAADQSKPNAYMIEIQQPLKLTWPGFISSGAKDQFPPNTADGSRQYAELNAEVEGILYQICQTVPGTKVYYEFYHGARGAVAGNNTDVMYFYLRAPGETSGLQKVCSDSYVRGSTTYNWGHYTGSYIVPAGQTQTEFAFESVSTTSGNKNMGNFLDGIRLYTNSYIDLIKSNNAPGGMARVGDLVTYTINVQNTGESDARNVKITDILPIGTEFVPGSIKIDNVSVPDGNYHYNAATRELSINVGAGATASQGGLILGNGSFSFDCNNIYTVTFQIKVNGDEVAENLLYENQARATYEDRYDLDFTPTQFVNYSNIDAFALDNRGFGAVLTDILPDGLKYISHTNANGSIFNIADQTCTWTWDALPYGETDVTVTVKVDPGMETEFVNHATLRIGEESSDTNHTYHELLTATTALTISKTVTGDFGDKNRGFGFSIYLEDSTGAALAPGTTLSYIKDAGGSTIETGTLTVIAGGVVTFSLKHGQIIIIDEVMVNSKIRIIEDIDALYDTSIVDSELGETKSNDTGEQMRDMTPDRAFVFTNHRIEVPKTAIDAGQLGFLIGLPILALLAGLVFLVAKANYRRRSGAR